MRLVDDKDGFTLHCPIAQRRECSQRYRAFISQDGAFQLAVPISPNHHGRVTRVFVERSIPTSRFAIIWSSEGSFADDRQRKRVTSSCIVEDISLRQVAAAALTIPPFDPAVTDRGAGSLSLKASLHCLQVVMNLLCRVYVRLYNVVTENDDPALSWRVNERP
jgi:hypothetical protein